MWIYVEVLVGSIKYIYSYGPSTGFFVDFSVEVAFEDASTCVVVVFVVVVVVEIVVDNTFDRN